MCNHIIGMVEPIYLSPAGTLGDGRVRLVHASERNGLQINDTTEQLAPFAFCPNCGAAFIHDLEATGLASKKTL